MPNPKKKGSKVSNVIYKVFSTKLRKGSEETSSRSSSPLTTASPLIQSSPVRVISRSNETVPRNRRGNLVYAVTDEQILVPPRDVGNTNTIDDTVGLSNGRHAVDKSREEPESHTRAADANIRSPSKIVVNDQIDDSLINGNEKGEKKRRKKRDKSPKAMTDHHQTKDEQTESILVVPETNLDTKLPATSGGDQSVVSWQGQELDHHRAPEIFLPNPSTRNSKPGKHPPTNSQSSTPMSTLPQSSSPKTFISARPQIQQSRATLNSPGPVTEKKKKEKRSLSSPAPAQQQPQEKRPVDRPLNSPMPAVRAKKVNKSNAQQQQKRQRRHQEPRQNNEVKKVQFTAATKPEDNAYPERPVRKRKRVKTYTEDEPSPMVESPRKNPTRKLAPRVFTVDIADGDDYDDDSHVEIVKIKKRKSGKISKGSKRSKKLGKKSRKIPASLSPKGAPVKNDIFSHAADNNVRVLYHLVRAKLVDGEIKSAFEICHGVLQKSYARAESLLHDILKPKSVPSKQQTATVMLEREKIAGVWCLYAHLVTQIADSEALLGSTRYRSDGGFVEKREEMFNSLEENLWNQAIAILSLCTACPFVGNHSSITIALSRLRLRQRQPGRQRPFPLKAISMGTSSYLASNGSSLTHWEDNLQAAMQICQDGMEKSSPLGNRGARPSVTYLANGDPCLADTVLDEKTIGQVANDLGNLLTNIAQHGFDESESAGSGPPAGFAFFAPIVNLPLDLASAIRRALETPQNQEIPTSKPSNQEHPPNKLPAQKQSQTKLPHQGNPPTKPPIRELPHGNSLPYLFVDPSSTKILCLEVNCLSRLKESLYVSEHAPSTHFVLAPSHLSLCRRSTHASAQNGAWDDTLHFQSMNAVLVQENSLLRPSKLATQLSTAASFLHIEDPVMERLEKNDLGSVKSPYHYVWHSLVHACPKCGHLCKTMAKSVLHRAFCEKYGKKTSCRRQDFLWEAWEDLPSAKQQESATDQGQVLSRPTKNSLRRLENKCYDIMKASECWSPPQKQTTTREEKGSASLFLLEKGVKENESSEVSQAVDAVMNDMHSTFDGGLENAAVEDLGSRSTGTRTNVTNLSCIFDEEAVAGIHAKDDSDSDNHISGSAKNISSVASAVLTTPVVGAERGRKATSEPPPRNNLTRSVSPMSTARTAAKRAKRRSGRNGGSLPIAKTALRRRGRTRSEIVFTKS